MAEYSSEALGRVVREARDRLGKTQEELGRAAGYKAGAGVSISRLETGVLRPGPEKLAGIARALGLTMEQLEAQAAASQADGLSAAPPTHGRALSEVKGPPGQKELNARRRAIEDEIGARTRLVTDLSETFNREHDRARDDFVVRLLEIAERIEGAPAVDRVQFEPSGDADDAVVVVASRLNAATTGVAHALAVSAGGAVAGAAVGGATAYGAFVAAASFGTASTGAAISGLSGVAATNATLALLGGGTLAAGGAGVAGGTLVLAGIVAAPAAVLFAGGLAWMARRNRRQRHDFAAQLDEAEAELSASKPGVDALSEILPRATEILSYVATHGGHALERWDDHLKDEGIDWNSLAEVDKQQYQSFVEVAAAHITVVMFNFEGLLVSRGDDLAQLQELAREVLGQAQDSIASHV